MEVPDLLQMEALYAKLYHKYINLKMNIFSKMDELNKDLEEKTVKCISAAEEFINFLEKENEELRTQNNQLRNEVAFIRSTRDEHYGEYLKLVIERNQKSGGGNDNGPANCILQFLVECLLGMKISTVNQNERICILALHESSGYSVNLTMVNTGAGKEAELLCQVISLGTLGIVAPDCMREDIIISRQMCPIFFDRVSRVIKPILRSVKSNT